MSIIIIIGLLIIIYYIIRGIRKERYFKSPEFLEGKAKLEGIVKEHNELDSYTEEIRSKGVFEFGASTTGVNSNLARGINTSRHKYRRDRNQVTIAPNVHHCSLQIARNAQLEPLKYLTKYFGFKANEETLGRVEEMGESFSRVENAVESLKAREASLTQLMEPPRFIKKHYMKEFMKHMGVSFSEISIPYPVYAFEYVSAGGNSGHRSEVVLNPQTIDALSMFLAEKIRWRKSVQGQRALMTSRLREEIKIRDNYACRNCGVSIQDEPHLLLEIDHIIPVSKGGMTSRENLQTLCWKCNRSKSNRIM